jgi:hypothetical protein
MKKRIAMIWNRFLRLLGRGDTGGTVPPPPPAREVLAFPTPGAPAWGVAMTDRRMLALHDAIDRHRGRVAALPIPSREAFERYSRKDFEEKWLPLRHGLQPLALSAALTGAPDRIAELEQCVLGIIGEPTWSVPWHGGKLPEVSSRSSLQKAATGAGHVLELHSAELGAELATVLLTFWDDFTASTRRLVAIELRDRILYPYSFGNVWANALTRGDNWTAVIHGCTGVVAMALEETGSEEAFEHVLIRREGLLEALTGYFQTAFSDDGYPLEGGAYWELGYRAWLDFAELADRLGKPVFELAFSPSARAANFGIRGAGQKGTAAAIGDSRLGRKLSAVTARRAARRYGLALPDWAESMRFASFTEAAFWLLGTDATEPRKYPPTGELYRGIARLSTITAAGSRFELFVHALPWTGLPHDQQAIGSWALHREGNPISGDPGYPKPYPGQFAAGRFEPSAAWNRAEGHPVVLHRVDGALQAHHKGKLESVEWSQDKNEYRATWRDVFGMGETWERTWRLDQDALRIHDRVEVDRDKLLDSSAFVVRYGFPISASELREAKPRSVVVPPSGYKGAAAWAFEEAPLALGMTVSSGAVFVADKAYPIG